MKWRHFFKFLFLKRRTCQQYVEKYFDDMRLWNIFTTIIVCQDFRKDICFSEDIYFNEMEKDIVVSTLNTEPVRRVTLSRVR
jgi:hypothetical protein